MLGDVRTIARYAPWGRELAWPRWYYGWTVVAVALVTVAVGQGTRAAYGVLFVALNDTFGWGRGVTAGAIAVGAVAWGVSAPLWGALFDRWGPRRVWSAAAALGGLGLAVAALTRE